MNKDDMTERGLRKYDLVDITSFAKDGSTRSVQGYRAIPYNLPRGSSMGYMPELNALCAVGDYSPQSDQPLQKHVVVEIVASKKANSKSPAASQCQIIGGPITPDCLPPRGWNSRFAERSWTTRTGRLCVVRTNGARLGSPGGLFSSEFEEEGARRSAAGTTLHAVPGYSPATP